MKHASRRFAVVILTVLIMQVVLPHAVASAQRVQSPQAGAVSLPAGRVGQAYEYQLRTEGGLPPLTWKVGSGSALPPGISLEASGKLKGIPTEPRRDAYSFVIEVADSSQPPQSFAQPFLLVIQAAPLRMVTTPQPLKIVTPEPNDVPPTAGPAEAAPPAENAPKTETPKAAPQPLAPAAGGQDAAKAQKLTVDTPVIDDKEITGKTEAGIHVDLYINDLTKPVKTESQVTANSAGDFLVPLGDKKLVMTDKIVVEVTHKDGSKEQSKVTGVADKPDAPSLDAITVGADVIRGSKAKPNAQINLFRNATSPTPTAEKQGPADSKGSFAIILDKSKPAVKGDKFQASQTLNKHESALSTPATEAKEAAAASDCKVPKIDELHLGSKLVTGSGADPGKEVQIFRNTTTGDPEAKGIASSDGTYAISLTNPLAKDDLIRVKEKNGDSCGFSAATGVVSPLDTTQGRLIGLAPFGNVISQQAEKISQADPFGGIIVGYMGPQTAHMVCRNTLTVEGIAKEKELVDKMTKRLEDTGLTEEQKDEIRKATQEEIVKLHNDPGNWKVYTDKKGQEHRGQYEQVCSRVASDRPFNLDAFQRTIEGKYSVVSLKKIPNLNWRIQGLFETAPRVAEAPVMDGPTKGELRRFIASRRSFDLELNGWWECMPGITKCSDIFRWGPYAAVGGTVALAKNELFGEDVSLPSSLNIGREVLDTTKVITSNDIDSHYEGGFMFNYYGDNLEDSNLYVQAIMAYGHYEGLAGLYPKYNTKNRFVGKLRVFPTGLNRSFFERAVAAPMFGVDLNAGRGEDNVRIFVGVAFNITKIISATNKFLKVP